MVSLSFAHIAIKVTLYSILVGVRQDVNIAVVWLTNTSGNCYNKYNHSDQMLSRKTIENLTESLMVDVANYVTEDPRFTELLNELVPEAIDLELGEVDDYSVVQIITSIQSHLRCSPNHSQVHYPRCPL